MAIQVSTRAHVGRVPWMRKSAMAPNALAAVTAAAISTVSSMRGGVEKIYRMKKTVGGPPGRSQGGAHAGPPPPLPVLRPDHRVVRRMPANGARQRNHRRRQ